MAPASKVDNGGGCGIHAVRTAPILAYFRMGGSQQTIVEPEIVQAVAGFASTVIFASSKIPMLLKAFMTKDMKSYGLGHIALSNTGNAIYWLYVVSLPVGPIWFLQGFSPWQIY